MPPAPSGATISYEPISMTGGEHWVRLCRIRGFRFDAKRIGKNSLSGQWQPIEEADLYRPRSQQCFDILSQRLVVTGRRGKERRPFDRWPVNGRLKQRLHLFPTRLSHGRPAGSSSRVTHAFAVRHSRLAVEAETFSTCATFFDGSTKRSSAYTSGSSRSSAWRSPRLQ
jgi:hypothetical protein